MIDFERLNNLKKQLDFYKPFPDEIIKNLDEWYKVELTYTSNAIEGNTLSRQETALVVEKGITVDGKTITEHLEAINHAKAWDYIQNLKHKSVKEITQQTVFDIHSQILDNIDNSNAGKYRNVPVRIAGSTVVMPNSYKVNILMKNFFRWLHSSNMNMVDLAIIAHYKFVSVHPFTDGNGRTGRLLMNLILMQGGFLSAIIRKEERKDYINAIEKGQLTEDISDYINMMYSSIERSLLIYLESFQPKKEVITYKSSKLLKIGELAKLTDEPVHTIRYWTKEGLLKAKDYSKGGYYLYDSESVKKVKQIRELQSEKRLTIKELKKYLN